MKINCLLCPMSSSCLFYYDYFLPFCLSLFLCCCIKILLLKKNLKEDRVYFDLHSQKIAMYCDREKNVCSPEQHNGRSLCLHILQLLPGSRNSIEIGLALKPQDPLLVTHILQQGSTSSKINNLSQNISNWGPSVNI